MAQNKDTGLLQKIIMAKSFLDSATFQEETSDLIRFDMVDSPLGEKVEYKRRKKRVTHFLYALVFELSIKIIYEIEQGEKAPHHHNIWSLYNKKLSPASKKRIFDMYDNQVSTAKNLIVQFNGLPDTDGRPWDLNLDMQSLEEALKANEEIVVNFKYDGQFKGKCSVLCSMMWYNDQHIILPKALANAIVFPKALLEYAISLKD